MERYGPIAMFEIGQHPEAFGIETVERRLALSHSRRTATNTTTNKPFCALHSESRCIASEHFRLKVLFVVAFQIQSSVLRYDGVPGGSGTCPGHQHRPPPTHEVLSTAIHPTASRTKRKETRFPRDR